jgi:putative resolvase
VDAYQLPTGTIIVRKPHTAATGGALYARVSAADQKDDALRQLQRRRDSAAARGALGVAEVSERAARLNDKHPKPTKVLPTPKVGSIVVEHQDRLLPVGHGSIATLLAQHGRRVEALSPSDTGDGVLEECVAVITRMVARIYGGRTSTRRAERIRACGARVLHRESEDA